MEPILQPLEPRLNLVDPPAALTPAREAEVAALWAQAQADSPGHLFDGPQFALAADARAGDGILPVWRASYRHLIAARRRPDLAASLVFRPLAVTGIVVNGDGLFLGRRGNRVATSAGMIEAVPAGGLDRLDPREALLNEAAEELGLSADDFTSIAYAGLFEPPPPEACEFVYLATTQLSIDAIGARHQALRDHEHPSLTFVAFRDLAAFLDQNRADLIPGLCAMLAMAAQVSPALAGGLGGR